VIAYCEHCNKDHDDWIVLDSNEDEKLAGPFLTRGEATAWVAIHQRHPADCYQICSASHWAGNAGIPRGPHSGTSGSGEGY